MEHEVLSDIAQELDMARDVIGRPLYPECRQAIERLYCNPTQETWDRAFCIALAGGSPITTLWQAVITLDKTFPPTGPRINWRTGQRIEDWPRIPDRTLLRKAIRFLTH